MSEPVWKTYEGEGIPLSQIEDSYLLNIERMLLGRGAEDWADREVLFANWYDIIRDEIERRGIKPLATHPKALERQEVGCQCGYDSEDADLWYSCPVHGLEVREREAS